MKDTPFRRLLHNAYEDGTYTPRGGFAEESRLPTARRVSVSVLKTERGSREEAKNRHNTILLAFWGQFVAHDISLTPVYTCSRRPLECCLDRKMARQRATNTQNMTPQQLEVSFPESYHLCPFTIILI